MNIELLVLRIIHVVGGVVWAGTAIFIATFLLPALGQAGPAAGPVMAALTNKKVFVIVPIIAILTMLAGLRLMWIASEGYGAAYFHTRPGMTYATGAVLSMIGFAIFGAVNRPALARIGELTAKLPTASDAEKATMGAEIGALRARALKGTRATATFLGAAAIAMAAARYL